MEIVISRTKAELNRPQTESKRPESGSTDQHPVSAKSDSSAREVRYHLSRTSDVGGNHKLTPQGKPVTVSARSEPAGGRVSSAVDTDVNSRGDQTISDVRSLKEKDKEYSSVSEVRAEERNLSLEKGESPLDKRVDVTLTDRTRTPDETLSENLRQSASSEHKKSIRDGDDSEGDIKDEARTAEDVSISEDIEVHTPSKASYSEKSEHSSRGSSKSLSVSRRKESDSDRKSSVRERSDVDSKITDEARTAEDLSISEGNNTVTKSRSSHSERDSTHERKKTKDADRSEQSSIISERKSIVSAVSKSSKRSKSPALSEKSRSFQQAYSSSFESVQSEVDKTEDDISEHISVEEDVKNSERSEVEDEVSTRLEKDTSKDGERTIDISEVPEDISSPKNEKSEIEDLHSTRKTTSISAKSSRPASEKTEQSVKGEKDLLRPEENKSGLSSYTDDFEPSALDETDEGRPQTSYTPEFEPSESNVPLEDDRSFQSKEEHEDISYYSKKSEPSGVIKVDDNKSSEDQRLAKIPTVELEQATDEESIAEELSENIEDLEEISKEDDSGSFFEKNDFDNELGSLRRQNEVESVNEKEKISNEVSPVSPDVHLKSKQTAESRIEESDQQTADRITQDLSTMLLNESMNCLTSAFEKRRRTAEDLPRQSAKDYRTSLEDDKDDVSQSVTETPEGDKISEHLSASSSEGSVSGLDRRARELEDLSPSPAEKPRQEAREEKSNDIVNKLSDALLKEAASQMIAIMRTRQETFAKAQGENTTDLHSPTKGTTEDEPHSGEESPLSSPRNNRFMAVQRFPDGLLKYTEDTSTPPGSPTSERHSSIDGKELTDKLDQLRRLHEHLEGARDKRVEGDDERSEFTVHSNALIEFPTEDEDEEEETFRRSRGASFLFSVPHRPSEVSPLVASSLSAFFERKRRGLPVDNVTPPSEIIGYDEADDDLEANSKRVYRRLVFDLTGSLFKELLSEEAPSKRPSWMKAKPRRKRRFHRGLQPLVHEEDFLPVVEQQVLNLIGLGDARPSLERVRRKTPLKAGKKDFVDAILIQELREEEPLWVDYDDDELAVKFQVADAIFESLLSETVMVVNAVRLRREARDDVARS